MPEYAAYGLRLACDRAWPGLEPAAGAQPAQAAVTVAQTSEADVQSRFTGPRGAPRTLATGDGPVHVIGGAEGDVLLDAAPIGVFHVGRDGSALAYATTDPARPAFQRMLLDTALGTAALMRGQEGLHAAAVSVDGRVIAVAAALGAGKTSLAVAALKRGAALFTDDLLFLSREAEAVVAHPGPPLLNLPDGAEAPGTVLATIGCERWIALHRPPQPPAPPALIVILDRRPGAGAPVALPETSPAALLAHALDSGPSPQRRMRRLDLLSSLAQTTPIVRLRAGVEATPDALAGAVVSLVT